MPMAIKILFTVLGVILVLAGIWLAYVRNADADESGHGGEITIGPIKVSVKGAGATMVLLGLVAIAVPWLSPPSDPALAPTQLDLAEWDLCRAPTGEYAVVNDLPRGPLNVRIGAGTDYAILKSLDARTDGLKFEGCATRVGGGTAWFKIEGDGWLFSLYVEPV